MMKILSLGLLTVAIVGLCPRQGSAADQPAKPPQFGPAVNGLQLGLRAESSETSLLPDGTNTEPLVWRVIFKNVGERPIKLDLNDWRDSRISLAVQGPDEKSVQIVPLPRRRGRHEPAPGDFPTLEAGGSLSIPFQWPGRLDWKNYALLKPGEYRVQITYRNPQVGAHPLAAGSWTGEVASNTVVLTVTPPEQ